MMNELNGFENHTKDEDFMLSLDEDTSLLNITSDICNTSMQPLATASTQISPYGTHEELVFSYELLGLVMIS